jgi:hypothetical protein
MNYDKEIENHLLAHSVPLEKISWLGEEE